MKETRTIYRSDITGKPLETPVPLRLHRGRYTDAAGSMDDRLQEIDLSPAEACRFVYVLSQRVDSAIIDAALVEAFGRKGEELCEAGKP